MSIARGRSARVRQRIQRLGFFGMTLAVLLTITPIVIIVGYIYAQGMPAISWTFLKDFPREGMRAGGILPAIVGTFWLTLGTGAIAVPLGVGAAIYLSEYAPDPSSTWQAFPPWSMASLGWAYSCSSSNLEPASLPAHSPWQL